MKNSWLVTLGVIIATACASGGTASAQTLDGFKFGVGIALTSDTGSKEVVRSADVFNGVVRVLDEDDQQVRVMFESHYFFTPDTELPLLGSKKDTWGVGPFIAFQAGEDQIISSVGLGMMIGFKRDADATSKAGDAFNIGLGVFIEPNSQVLGDGIVANQPLPAGETAVRYKEESQVSWGILTSFSF